MTKFLQKSPLIQIIFLAGFFLGSSISWAIADDEYLYHYVRSGDTLSGISSRYRVGMKDLLDANPGLSTRKILRIGQELKVPNVIGLKQKKSEATTILSAPDLSSKLMESGETDLETLGPTESRYEETTYTLKKGDKLGYISQAFRVSTETLLERNPILEESKAVENITLIIPANMDLGKKMTEKVVSSISDLFPFRFSPLNGETRHLMSALEASLAARSINPLQENSVIRAMGNAPTLSFSAPAFGRVSSRYGKRWMGYHHGIDIAAPIGTPIYAAKGGKVISAGWAFRYGRLIRIEHSNGISTYYAHCSKMLVKKGDWVAEGQKIGEIGNTGRSSGPHLHFEVRLDGKAVNPTAFIIDKIKPEFAIAEQPAEEKEDRRVLVE